MEGDISNENGQKRVRWWVWRGHLALKNDLDVYGAKIKVLSADNMTSSRGPLRLGANAIRQRANALAPFRGCKRKQLRAE